jgi:hypothetical protein
LAFGAAVVALVSCFFQASFQANAVRASGNGEFSMQAQRDNIFIVLSPDLENMDRRGRNTADGETGAAPTPQERQRL